MEEEIELNLAEKITNYFFQNCKAVIGAEDYHWVKNILKDIEEKAWKYDGCSK